jgi:hypothetical protein
LAVAPIVFIVGLGLDCARTGPIKAAIPAANMPASNTRLNIGFSFFGRVESAKPDRAI